MNFSFPRLARPLLITAVLSVVLSTSIYLRPPKLDFTVEMASAAPSQAQLFYDTGTGFHEAASVFAPVRSQALRNFEQLTFALPVEKLSDLRFDPLTSSGHVAIRRIGVRNHDTIVREIALSHIVSLNQISSMVAEQEQVVISTTPGANDPQLRIVLEKPLDLSKIVRDQTWQLLVVVNGCLIAALVMLIALERHLFRGWTRSLAASSRVHAKLGTLSQSLSGRFMSLDALAIWVYVGLLACFLIGSALDLSRSSTAVLDNETYHDGAALKNWTTEQPARLSADQVAFETPAILNQIFRADRFAVEDSLLGNHFIALTGNIPVKDLTTVFRPQFWPFFVLHSDYAYAMYWQAKAMLLISGVFTFLLWITGSSVWALSGALSYFFSTFKPWSYSWPLAMPEMVGLACFGMFFFCYLTVGSRRWMLAVAAAGAIICSIDFSMCADLPHLVPVVWVAFAVGVAWFAANWRLMFSVQLRTMRIGLLVLVAAVVSAVVLDVHMKLKPGVLALAEASYLHGREFVGETLPLWKFGSHFLQWTKTQQAYPARPGDLCDLSGFLWLAPVTLFCLPGLILTRFQKTILIALWASALLLVCGEPLLLSARFGNIFGPNRYNSAQMLPALGLLNIAIVALTAARYRPKPMPRGVSVRMRTAAYFLIGFLVSYLVLGATNGKTGGHFDTSQMVLTATILALLCVLIMFGKRHALAFCLVAPQMVAFGAASPIRHGSRFFTDSALSQFVQNRKQLLAGRWLVYSDKPVDSGFFAAAGCSVYTGLRYIPDVDHFRVFASRGVDLNVINTPAFLTAKPSPAEQRGGLTLERTGIISWKVAPNDPIVSELGIRYVAFDSKPEAVLTKGLTPVTDRPLSGFWIYRMGHIKK